MAVAVQSKTGVLSVRIEAFAAVLRVGEQEETLGQVAGDETLPKAVRRRLSVFDLGVARCICGVARPGVDEEIVFGSRYGNMDVMTELLTQLAKGELLSPARFSMSVHNAAVGAASQMTANRAGHTSVAAGTGSFRAALTESWLRLDAGTPSVIAFYSDLPLQGVYAGFDEPGPAVQVALRLTAGEGAGYRLADGRTGAEALVRAVAQGERGVAWAP